MEIEPLSRKICGSFFIDKENISDSPASTKTDTEAGHITADIHRDYNANCRKSQDIEEFRDDTKRSKRNLYR